MSRYVRQFRLAGTADRVVVKQYVKKTATKANRFTGAKHQSTKYHFVFERPGYPPLFSDKANWADAELILAWTLKMEWLPRDADIAKLRDIVTEKHNDEKIPGISDGRRPVAESDLAPGRGRIRRGEDMGETAYETQHGACFRPREH